jgi:molybdopterin converting factor small subunit
MIRVIIPAHLRTLAKVDGEVQLDVAGTVTTRSVLDALEAKYPVLRGTIRHHVTLLRGLVSRISGCAVAGCDRQRRGAFLRHRRHCRRLSSYQLPQTFARRATG